MKSYFSGITYIGHGGRGQRVLISDSPTPSYKWGLVRPNSNLVNEWFKTRRALRAFAQARLQRGHTIGVVSQEEV